MMRSILAVTLILPFVACLPTLKTGCLTTDDCTSGRVCVNWTCQPAAHDASLEANSNGLSPGDAAGEFSETSGPDMTIDLQASSDWSPFPVDVLSDGPSTFDATDAAGADDSVYVATD